MYDYNNVYSFEVIRKLSEAISVRCLDKQSAIVYNLETLTVLEVFELINLAEKEENRLYFYSQEEKKNV